MSDREVRVLVVEDDRVMAETLRNALTGCIVDLAEGVEEAESKFDEALRGPRPYDAFVIDYNLEAERTGLDFCKRVIDGPGPRPTPPIVFYTAHLERVAAELGAIDQHYRAAISAMSKEVGPAKVQERLMHIRQAREHEQAIDLVCDLALESAPRAEIEELADAAWKTIRARMKS